MYYPYSETLMDNGKPLEDKRVTKLQKTISQGEVEETPSTSTEVQH